MLRDIIDIRQNNETENNKIDSQKERKKEQRRLDLHTMGFILFGKSKRTYMSLKKREIYA